MSKNNQSHLKKRFRSEKLKISHDSIKNHNSRMINTAFKFKEELIKSSTKAEKKLLSLLIDSPLYNDFEFQHIIYIKKKRRIEKFYIADFCFPSKKIIIELDGKYHYTPEQIKKDKERALILKRCGYILYRIDNHRVLYKKGLNSLIIKLIKTLKR